MTCIARHTEPVSRHTATRAGTAYPADIAVACDIDAAIIRHRNAVQSSLPVPSIQRRMTLTRITSIEFQLNTGNLSGAGTDGDVYLGVCGREFYVDTTEDDFERGSSRKYIFGDGANVNNLNDNDPRDHSLHIENVDNFPVYVRFEPRSRSDNWHLQRAEVSFNGNFFPRWDTNDYIPQRVGIWMGTRSTLFVHIPRHSDDGIGMAVEAEEAKA